MTWSYKFTLHDLPLESIPRAWLTVILQRTHILQYLHYFLRYWSELFIHAAVFKKPYKTIFKHTTTYNRGGRIAFKLLQLAIAFYYMIALANFGIRYLDWKDASHALVLGGITAARVIVVVFISSCIWVPIGVWIGLRPRLTAIVQPLAQFLAAFPANVLFPLVVITLLKFQLPFEMGVLPLMLLSTQWYILFNVIAGMGAIPKELYQMAQNLGVTGWIWWKRLILPGIFPYLIIGVMTAVGAAWNISVVAEVMQWGQSTLSVTGLGAYIHHASEVGDFNRVAVGMIAMSLWVLMMNYVVWQPLYRVAQSKYRLN